MTEYEVAASQHYLPVSLIMTCRNAMGVTGIDGQELISEQLQTKLLPRLLREYRRSNEWQKTLMMYRAS